MSSSDVHKIMRGWKEVQRLEDEIQDLQGELGADRVYESDQTEDTTQSKLNDDEGDEVAKLLWKQGSGAQGVTVSPIHEGGAGPAGNKYERDAIFDEEFPIDAEEDDRNTKIEPVEESIFSSQHPAIKGRARASQIIVSTFENSIDSLSGLFHAMMMDSQRGSSQSKAHHQHCHGLGQQIDQLSDITVALKVHLKDMLKQLAGDEPGSPPRSPSPLQEENLEEQFEREKRAIIRAWESDVERQADILARQSTTIARKSNELQALGEDRHRLLLECAAKEEELNVAIEDNAAMQAEFENEKTDMFDFFANKLHESELKILQLKSQSESPERNPDSDQPSSAAADDPSEEKNGEAAFFNETLTSSELDKFLNPRHTHSISAVSPGPVIRANSSISWPVKMESEQQKWKDSLRQPSSRPKTAKTSAKQKKSGGNSTRKEKNDSLDTPEFCEIQNCPLLLNSRGPCGPFHHHHVQHRRVHHHKHHASHLKPSRLRGEELENGKTRFRVTRKCSPTKRKKHRTRSIFYEI